MIRMSSLYTYKEIIQISFAKLHKRDRSRLVTLSFLQTISGLLDVLAVGFVGVIGALAVRGIQSTNQGDRTSQILTFLGISSFSFQQQVAILSAITTGLFLFRTLFSILLTRRVLFFLSKRAAQISKEMIDRILRSTLNIIQKSSLQENIYALTTGVNVVTLGLLGSFSSLVADTILVIFLVGALAIIDPLIALLSIILFGTTGIILVKVLHGRVGRFGAAEAQMSIKSDECISEALSSFREISLRNSVENYSAKIGILRNSMGDAIAEITFIPNIGKYIVEAILILGTVSIATIEFSSKNSASAFASLSVFLAAGSRIAPAILRIQQSFLTIKSSAATGKATIELWRELSSTSQNVIYREENGLLSEFSPKIEVRDLFFRYPESNDIAIQGINLTVVPGTFVAIVGPSGSGKSTLVDLLLGALQPTSGEILVSGLPISAVVRRWPGLIGYVPQKVEISPGTIRENLLLGLSQDGYQESDYLQALEMAELLGVVGSISGGLDGKVGDSGTKLSGGQKQRLGLARALFTNPSLLVLDEATSSLDAETEASVSRNLQRFRGARTVLVIAHRLSTVKMADQVIYLDSGKILASGTFENVRRQVLDFDAQAKLMGL